MDDQVLRAMQRWPDVPAVFGWLRLDRRGRWCLVDRGQPGFDESRDGHGSPITNAQIVDFIARNYQGDDDGRWYWQNGPQRVYVDLEVAPLILRVRSDLDAGALLTHTGAEVGEVSRACVGEHGELLAMTDLGPGAIHDLDLAALELTETHVVLAGNRLVLGAAGDQAATLGFVRRPR
ncbi:MAG: DUF2946 family protein [Burkholderiaceae bacterium]